MFDDAALALEEIAPEDKIRSEVLSARMRSIWLLRDGTWLQRWQIPRESGARELRLVDQPSLRDSPLRGH